MMNHLVLRFSLHRSGWRIPLLGMLPVLSLVSGVVVSEVAHAQQPPGNMTKYTSVARQIEKQRMQDYAEVKQILGGNVPENVCKQSNLPQQVREICDRFDSNSRKIITGNGMSISEFNAITMYCQKSPKPQECPR